MTVLIYAIPISLILGFGFLLAFIWSVDADQFDDLIEKGNLPLEGNGEDQV